MRILDLIKMNSEEFEFEEFGFSRFDRIDANRFERRIISEANYSTIATIRIDTIESSESGK